MRGVPPGALLRLRRVRHVVFARALGLLDYERLFDERAAGIGLGTMVVPEEPGSSLHVSVPMTLSFLGIRDEQHVFEVGLGAAIVASSCNAPNPCGVFWPEPVSVAAVVLDWLSLSAVKPLTSVVCQTQRWPLRPALVVPAGKHIEAKPAQTTRAGTGDASRARRGDR